MHIPLVDLKAQYASIKPEIDSAINEVISTTAFVGGKYVKQFESDFARYVGTKYCVGCGNGTDALEILLQSFRIGEGDEVIVPANSFIATSEAVSHVGAVPVFVDTHPKYFTIDPSAIERKISNKTKAIIPVHLYGLPAPMDEILEIARKRGLKVIEDAAQAHGARYKGKHAGSLADGAAFSFYPGKNLGAYGDGGAIVTDDEEIAVHARMLANHGRISKYDHEMEGRNSRLDGIQAAILTVKLKYLDKWVELRNRNAAFYNSFLANKGFPLPVVLEHSKHAYHLYVILVDNREVIQERLRSKGVETGVHYPIPLPLLQAYKRFGHTPADFPVCSSQMHRLLSLPMYPELEEEQIQSICNLLKESCD
jgi:dTDP-4-amino-4,6-dideoxygalactose transaminase